MNDIFKAVFLKDTVAKIFATNEFFKRIISFIKENRIVVKACSLCMIGLFALTIGLASSGFTIGFNVSYAGEVIATVQNASVFNEAKTIALGSISGDFKSKAIEKPHFSLTLTVSDKLDNAYKLADALIKNSNGLVSAYALIVDGETAVCSYSENLAEYLEQHRTRYYIDGAENSAEFVDNVKIQKGYYLKDDISDLESTKAVIDSLPVKTVSMITTDTEIPYTKKTVKTEKKIKGYSEVTTAGQNGISRKIESMEKMNGSLVSRTSVSDTIIKTPVDEITTIGTADSQATVQARAAEFILPLNSGSFTVSAYFGDGRGHKGVDLAANRGTEIYAVKSGTVVYSGFYGDYGYSVVIDHGNGLKTRYAHASSLNVIVGDTVSQGDTVALVGSTGLSTGNHLHFEVLVNGSAVNPAPYIGL